MKRTSFGRATAGSRHCFARALPYNIVIDPLKTLDASISYKLTDSLSITLDGSKLLDQAYNDYHSVPQLPRDIRRYDRVVGLALRWRN
jgi:iron complex outermembrane receptor protein